MCIVYFCLRKGVFDILSQDIPIPMEWKNILSPWNGEHRSALREKNEDQILGVEPVNELYPQRALKSSILAFISL